MGFKRVLYRHLISKRINLTKSVSGLISDCETKERREAYQLEQFNFVWNTAWRNVPYYSDWKDKYALPDAIGTLDELNDWPILTKDDLRNFSCFERKDVSRPRGRILTGGSTGTPVRLPGWFDQMAGVSQTIGRARYGVTISDRVFLLWGHEHLYGAGFKKIINKYKRRIKDWIADWKRVSAYDLSLSAMRKAYEKMVAFSPSVVIAYSPAIISFCRQNKDCIGLIKSVKTVICSAGPLSGEEKEEVARFFSNAKVCLEYGTVECGIIAYTRPSDGEYEVFWNTHLVQALKVPSGEVKAIITRLTECYVPIIRYDVGDYLDIGGNNDLSNGQSVFVMHDIKGRPTELLKFANGIEFFAWTVGDCVKQVPEIYSHQIVVDENNNRLEIRVTAGRPLTVEEKNIPIDRLYRIIANGSSLNVQVTQVDKLYMTVGGKTPRVVRL